MGFGSRATPQHVLGMPGQTQVWRYRGKDYEIEPRKRKRGEVWVLVGGLGTFADVPDAVAEARYWRDLTKWAAESPLKGRDTQTGRQELMAVLLHNMALEASSRASFGHTIAQACSGARRGTPEWRAATARLRALCDVFDDLPLSERRKLLDTAWERRERHLRAAAHEQRVKNPKGRKGASKKERRKLLNRLLRI
jgi:hypothetical protein